ncbi:MAG: MGMT family protein [bacterium]
MNTSTITQEKMSLLQDDRITVRILIKKIKMKMDINIKIYKFLQSIPKGKVVSYKFLAQKFDIHPRYVGKILHQNKYPDKYPCYKVIKSDRTLG